MATKVPSSYVNPEIAGINGTLFFNKDFDKRHFRKSVGLQQDYALSWGKWRRGGRRNSNILVRFAYTLFAACSV